MKYTLSIPIIAFLYVIVICSSSQYKGVTWYTKSKKWKATVCFNGKKIHVGRYPDELDAAKRVNQMCDEFGIERKNPGIDARPSANPTNLSSKYKGVIWDKYNLKWTSSVYFNSKKINGGPYRDELDAARRVNQLCNELKIERKNPEVDANPIKHYKRGFSSQYSGVCWVNTRKLWKSEIRFGNQHNVSYHVNELDAARKVNQWCDEFVITQKKS